jgi:hypothetical protein
MDFSKSAIEPTKDDISVLMSEGEISVWVSDLQGRMGHVVMVFIMAVIMLCAFAQPGQEAVAVIAIAGSAVPFSMAVTKELVSLRRQVQSLKARREPAMVSSWFSGDEAAKRHV